MLDLAVDDVNDGFSRRSAVSGCRAITMGKVAWDANQINRTQAFDVDVDYPELAVFRAALTHLGRAKILSGKNGGYAVPKARSQS